MAFEGTIISLPIQQFLRRLAAFALFALFGVSSALGLGLGEMKLRSFLGQGLLVQLELVGAESEFFNVSCVRARVMTFDGTFLANVHVAVQQLANKRQLLLSTRQHINEPAVNLVVDMNCEMQLHREFSILLDLPDQSTLSNVHVEELSAEPARHDTSVPAKSNSTRLPVASAEVPSASRKRASVVGVSPESEAVVATLKKPKRQKTVAAKDVLRLSDDVVPANLEQGLRMSDVLSTPTGQNLLENMQELRAAQARMAAILRDEGDVKSRPASDLRDLGEINQLKKEAEQLKKQNQIDRASLLQLQSKSAFDYWLLALSVVAVFAILVIIFLLSYIRRNLGAAKPDWWEDEAESEPASHVRIEDVIDQLQSKYDINTDSDQSAGKVTTELTPSVAADKSSAKSQVQDSGTQRTPTLEETNSSIFNFYSPRATSVKVEEISDVTQEAEFWISMNDPQRAIEILAAQERVECPDSPLPWLFLLDLYRTVGERDKYEQLRERFICFFNANIPEYEADLSVQTYRQLDDFPHILEKICALWGSAGALPYLEALLVDDRKGARSGFDLPVYRDILMLIGIARELERYRLAEAKFEAPVSGASDAKSAIDPVGEADFGTIDFEMIEFPLTDPDAKRSP